MKKRKTKLNELRKIAKMKWIDKYELNEQEEIVEGTPIMISKEWFMN